MLKTWVQEALRLYLRASGEVRKARRMEREGEYRILPPCRWTSAMSSRLVISPAFQLVS